MWLKVFLIVGFTFFCASMKFDYEFEELNLLCVFEQMSDGYV